MAAKEKLIRDRIPQIIRAQGDEPIVRFADPGEYRYLVGTRPLPRLRRTAHLVFTRAKVAVFLDGCFWHGCPEHFRPANVNRDFWNTKIAANRARDLDTDSKLAEVGWIVIRVWEHEDPKEAARRIASAVRGG